MMPVLKSALAGLLLTALSGAASAQSADTVTVYTSQPTEQMAAVIEAFNKDHPEIKVDLFRSGTTEVMNKLQAEFQAGSPQADVVLIADAVAMTRLKNDDRLMTYADAPVENLPASVVDPDRTFFGTKLITTGIIYNTNLVKTPPTSWKDLTAPDVASKLIMPSPLYSGAAVIHVGTVVQQPELGWDYYQTLADAGAVAGQGNGTVVDAVARGEKAYGIIIEYMALNAKAKGSPVDFVFPAEGVSVITQPVAILKGTKHEAAAKAFVDWQLSKAAQEQSVAQGYFPIFPDMTPPKGYPAVSSLKFLDADYTKMLGDDEANKKEFAELFGG
ncbi:ABC transporter substrate-binding protein [Mangrovibrevibacter kandeliae]|uniref:ABC transporter substrate-binding protein n=1 Tax=Mangrovibrevibacter kandeliae TaxID=2968473 RepID=UPI0021196654|nr:MULTISPECIES: ABC transporter substrate-binding protein [unclassified Aurantimonas]MCQ8783120.1 ABC transporter substrate-binding protein [Aurantimonas sp. CSK15Z-1]MCW4115691.1 ABC transporter substrate-binding protein [Aurantimonas sp. MSK8Z-1]